MLSINNLKDYQKAGVDIIASQKKCALFMKPGMGKTVTTFYGLSKLEWRRALIVAPKRVCETVWPYECDNWKELKGRYSFTWINGTPIKRTTLLEKNTDFHLITYELLPWLVSEVKLWKHYDVIIFDELSKLKSPSAKRFKAIRHQIIKIPISIGLTGTPTGNSLLGLWTQVYSCLGPSTPLQSNYTAYKQKYFYQGGFEGKEWIPFSDKTQRRFPGRNTLQEILEDIQKDPKGQRVHSFELLKEYCPVSWNEIPVSFTAKVLKQYQQLSNDFSLCLNNGTEITAPSAAALKNKLRQFESGAVYLDDEGTGINRPYEVFHTAKIDALKDLVDELSGDPLIIVYEFKHELARLQKEFKGIPHDLDYDVQQRWNRGELPVIALHPASAGHGLNLQAGGANMAFMSLPWSLELWQQVTGRIYRTGQQRTCNFYTFKGFEVEGQVYGALRAHKEIEASVFKNLRATTS